MPYVYLVQCSYFKEDVFKIGGSEKIENDRLKSYGKGTKILAMVVVTGDFHHVENQIKVSFNSKFTLIHGKEYFQGNEDEIKLEFLKIVYNHQMTNSQKMTVVSKVDTVKDTVVESKVEGDDTLKQFINDKIQIVRNIDYEKLNCSDKQLNRTKKCVLLELYIDYIKNNSTTINKIKKTEFYNKIKEQFKIEMMKSNGIRYYLCKYKIEEVKNDIVVESEVDTVVNETEVKSYINEVDIQGQFVDERIEIISKENYEQTPKLQKCNKRMNKEALYGLFVSYAIEQGVRIKISKIDFHKGLSKHNIETITCQGFPFYLCSEKVFKSDTEVVTIVNDTEVESEVVTIVNDTEVDTTESLMKLAKTELQERCKKAGFCSSGIKNDLVKYLTNISKVDTVNNIVIESKTVIPINDIVVECKTDSIVKETVVDIVVESEVDIVVESEVDIVIEFEKRDENVILQRGRHRVIPNLQGETDIAREQRLNRVYVQKFRNKIRTERGLPPPKKYDKTRICGESEIDREKRLNRERVNRFRESKKATHNNSNSINDTVVESKVDTIINNIVVESKTVIPINDTVVESKTDSTVKETVVECKVDTIVKDYVVESKTDSTVKETVVESKVIPTKQFIYQNKEIVEVQLGKLVHSKYIRERNGMIYKRTTRVVHYSEPTLSYHPTACVQAHITEEQMHEYNTEHNLTAKYDGDTNSICIFCLQLCVRGYFNRYENIQGCYKGNEDDIRLLYACDKCAHWDNDRLFDERQILGMPDGKFFIIDAIHRANY